MPRDGAATRTRILDTAEELVLEKGFAGTSVDEVIASAATTKGGFFHHFASKQELARGLVERYVAADMKLLDDLLARAERLSSDPLQQLLLFVGLQEELADELAGDVPGCLYASFMYEQELFDDTTREVIGDAVRAWRSRTREKLEEVAERYPPRIPVDLDTLADQGLAVYEGTFVLSRALGEPELLGGQLRHFRSYLELLFTPAT
ncbi:MAG TPA: TetR/AcrR family transcriptional regulator [Gaiellaceae bacterium]|nr:TetR/AcrR family transcriptional regulator [Gaiellaceae bacterium]